MQCLFSAFTENDGILILENSTHGIQISLHIIYDHDFFSGSFLNHLLSSRLFRIRRNRIEIFRWKNRNIKVFIFHQIQFGPIRHIQNRSQIMRSFVFIDQALTSIRQIYLRPSRKQRNPLHKHFHNIFVKHDATGSHEILYRLIRGIWFLIRTS